MHNHHPRRLRRLRRAGPRAERPPPRPRHLSSRRPPGRPEANNRRRRRLRLRRCGRPPPGRIPPFLDPSHKSTNAGKGTNL